MLVAHLHQTKGRGHLCDMMVPTNMLTWLRTPFHRGNKDSRKDTNHSPGHSALSQHRSDHSALSQDGRQRYALILRLGCQELALGTDLWRLVLCQDIVEIDIRLWRRRSRLVHRILLHQDPSSPADCRCCTRITAEIPASRVLLSGIFQCLMWEQQVVLKHYGSWPGRWCNQTWADIKGSHDTRALDPSQISNVPSFNVRRVPPK